MKKKIKFIGIIIVILIVSIFGVNKRKKYYDNKKEEERLAKDPYFTEFKLSRREASHMYSGFYCDFEPYFDGHLTEYDVDKSKWPDYSYYTMTATEDTEKIVTVLNYDLFDENNYRDDLGKKRAKEMGFTSDKRLTVDWVMSHPKEAVYIMSGMAFNGELFQDYDRINYKYNAIISGEIESQAE